MLGPPDFPPTLGTVPGAEDLEIVMQGERVNREVEAQGNAPEAGREGRVHRPTHVGPSPEIPDSPPLTIHLPSPPSSFDKNCAPTRRPALGPGSVEHLSYDQSYNLREQRGYLQKDAKEVLKTRLAATQAQPVSNARNLPIDANLPVTSAAKRGRPPADVAENLQDPTFAPGRRF